MMLFLAIALLGATVLGSLFLIPSFTFSIKDKQGHNVPQSIALLEKVNLGGQEQWILIRGMDITKPIVLFLHGGPGTSNMCLLRKYTDELEKHFIVVTWDQRGAGKSYRAINPHSSMTIDRFILDTGELTQLLCDRCLLGKYGGELYGSSKGAFPLIFSSLICATEYTLIDKVNFFKGIFISNHLLWQELLTINLKKQVSSFKAPIYFVLGKHDYEAPSVIAEQYFKIIEAPKKELIWFENSAHFADIEENKKFNDLLVNHVLPTIAIF